MQDTFRAIRSSLATRSSLVTLSLTLIPLYGTYAAEPLEPYPVKGQVIQRLSVFDNPEGSIFSADGRFVFISNSAELGNAEKGFHWTHKAGYVSKLAVQPDGTLKVINDKLITGLTGPLGFAVSPVSTKKFPKGTIFLIEAWAPLATADGTTIKDPSVLDPKIIAFNDDGRILGSIKLGSGSAAAQASGVVVTLGNALAFDKEGNLYAVDTGIAGGLFEPPIETKGGGVYLIPAGSIDDLADGKSAPVHYVAFPDGGPDGVEVAPDGAIHVNTVGAVAGLKDPADGGQYRLTKEDFRAGRLPAPFATGLGALDGLDFAGSVRLDTEIKNTSSILVTPPFGRAALLTYDQDIKLAGPADIAVRKQADGSFLLVIPELAATSPNNRDNTVTVVRLPAGFDRF